MDGVDSHEAGASPRSRVDAFVAAYYAGWTRSNGNAKTNPSTTTFDFDRWALEKHQLMTEHFLSMSSRGLETVNYLRPLHMPGKEATTSEKAGARSVLLRTVMDDPVNRIYYAYMLSKSADGWRIKQLLESYDPPGTPLIPAADAARLVSRVAADSPLPDMPEDAPDVGSFFASPREVLEVGTLTTSGILTVHDFAALDWQLAPLSRPVPAGTYAVEVARDETGTNTALRLRLTVEDPAQWRPAEKVGSDALVLVDAGNVAILDFRALATCDTEHATHLFETAVPRILDDRAAVVSLTGGAPDAVVVDSGSGDGAFSIYWGMTVDGAPAALVVDLR